MRRALVVVAAAFPLLLVTRPAAAYRPFDGTDADVSGLGELELEIGPLGYLRESRDSALVFANTVINFGFLPRWEIVAEGVGLWGFDFAPPPRFIDSGVFLKHVLREGSLQEGGRGISLATEFGLLFPANDEPFVSGTGLWVSLIASQAWREIVLHVNVAISRSSDGQPDFFASTIIEGHPHARIRPVAELFVDQHDGKTVPSALLGFILRVRDTLTFDGATRLAWSNDAPLFEIRAGLTWTIPLVRSK